MHNGLWEDPSKGRINFIKHKNGVKSGFCIVRNILEVKRGREDASAGT